MKKQLLLLALALSGATFAQNYQPITATGYNFDVIAEDTTAMNFTTGTLDANDYILYSVDYGNIFFSGSGLPNNGTIVSGTRSYQLAAYTGDNAIVLGTGETDSLELVTPASYASLSLLGFATEGEGQLLIVLKFSDGSGTVFSNNVLPDWFNNSGEIISGFDRAGRTTNMPDFQFGEPRMYPIDINLSCDDQLKTLVNIMIINTTASPTIKTSIFAVSGIAPVNAQLGTVTASCFDMDNGSAAITVTGGAPDVEINWSTTPVQTGLTATDLAPGTYEVIITDAVGCDDTISGIVITENPDINSAVTTVSATTLSADQSGATYQWLDCTNNNAPIAGQTGQTFVATAAGSYAVAVTMNNCTEVSTCIALATASVNEFGTAFVQLSPNPVSDELTIQATAVIGSVEVVDLTGKAYAVAVTENHIAMGNLAAGTYLVRITTAEGTVSVSRIVKK